MSTFSVFRSGMRRQLLLLSLALTLPLAMLAVVRAFERSQREREELADQGRRAAVRATQLLDDDVNRARLLLAGASRILDPREVPARNDSLISAIFSEAAAGFSNIWLSDARGMVRGSLVRRPELSDNASLAAQPYFDEVQRAGTFTIGQPMRSVVNPSAPFILPFIQPVRDSRTGNVIGYVGAGLRIDRMAAVQYVRDLPPNSVLTVLRRDGRVLLRSQELEKWIELNFVDSSAFKADPKVPSGMYEVQSLDGTMRIVAQDTLRTMSAIAYVGIPVSATLDVVQRQLRIDLMVGLMLTLMMAAVSLFMASRIAAPLEEVTDVATALARGQRDRRADVQGTEEVVALGQAVNAMADAVADRERELAASEDRYRQLFATSPLPTFTWRLSDGRLDQMNDAARAFYGDRIGEACNARVLDLFSEEDRERFAALPLPMESSTLRAGQWQQVDARGDVRTVELIIGRLEQSAQTLAVGVLLDVTDRLRAEHALEVSRGALRQAQQLEALGAFAGGIAHDFNNYLSAIATNAEILREELELESPHRREASEILAAAQRASHLTRQILVFSRRQIVHEEALDINAELHELEHLLARLVGENITLVLHCAPDTPHVMFSQERFEQVMMNLAANARDAMPDGGSLYIRTARAMDGRLELTVRDTGAGITPDVLPRIFEPFFTTKPRDRGTGLGLSMVYSIITGARGEIRVASAPDEGTTFHITLPGVTRESPRSPRREPEGMPLRGREHVLVVEDDAAVRSATVALLARAGYRVSAASGAGEAIDLLTQLDDPPHLLLTDVVMPEVSGPELVSRVEGRFPDMRVVFMSGYADDDAVMRGVAARKLELVAKPFSASELLGTIRRILDAASP